MAAPNPLDGAAARLPADLDVDEPMEVDPQLMDLMKTMLLYMYSEPSVGNRERIQR